MRFFGSDFVARVLVAVMLATLLSPSFGWHMHAGHHEIEAAADSHDLGHGHDQGGHHSGDDGEGEIDAHASIGHLLGHLPMQLMQSALFIASAEAVAPDDAVPVPLMTSDSSPPYRPPLGNRLA